MNQYVSKGWELLQQAIFGTMADAVSFSHSHYEPSGRA